VATVVVLDLPSLWVDLVLTLVVDENPVRPGSFEEILKCRFKVVFHKEVGYLKLVCVTEDVADSLDDPHTSRGLCVCSHIQILL